MNVHFFILCVTLISNFFVSHNCPISVTKVNRNKKQQRQMSATLKAKVRLL